MKATRIVIAVLLLLALLASIACVDSRRPQPAIEPTYSFARDGTIVDVQGQVAIDAAERMAADGR